MRSLGCVQCGGRLSRDRRWWHFCSDECQQKMDAYILKRMRTKPKRRPIRRTA